MTSLHFVLAAPLLLALSLPAQDGTTTQDPEKQGQTTAEQLKELQAEKVRLQKEIHYAKERAGNAKNLLQQKLTRPEQQFRAIDAGTAFANLPQTATPAARRFARVMTAEELGQQPEDTMLVVEGRGINQGYFDKVMDYMREHGAGDAATQAQRVLFDMIRIEAMAAAFYESEGEGRFGDALGQVQSGKSIAELAKEVGSVMGADPEGRVEVTRNSPYGAFFESVAFTTEPGTDAAPFRNSYGYVLMHVDSIQKGATEEQDKVVCHVAQVDYADRQDLSKAQLRVNTGQIDILARDQQVLEMLPALFRQQAINPAVPTLAPTDRRVQIEAQVSDMRAELEKLESSGDADPAHLDKLRKKLEALETVLKSMPANEGKVNEKAEMEKKPAAEKKTEKDGK